MHIEVPLVTKNNNDFISEFTKITNDFRIYRKLSRHETHLFHDQYIFRWMLSRETSFNFYERCGKPKTIVSYDSSDHLHLYLRSLLSDAGLQYFRERVNKICPYVTVSNLYCYLYFYINIVLFFIFLGW